MPSAAFLIDQLILAFTLIGLVLLGGLLHEIGHLLLAKLFGGEPHFDQYHPVFRIPTRVHFKKVDALTNFQVRIIGGFPSLFLILLFWSLWVHNLPLVWFSAGGALTISNTDLRAVHTPELWKKMAAEEVIYPEDYK